MPAVRETAELGEERLPAPRSALVALRRWFIAAVVISLAIVVLTVTVRGSVLEGELLRSVEAELAADGEDWATVRVEGRDVIVMGTAPAITRQEAALATAAGVFGVAVVRDETNLIPLATPFVWSATLSGDAVSLSGFVPSEDSRAGLARALRTLFVGSPVDDATILARGAPPGFEGAAAFAARVLTNFDQGTVALDGFQLAIEGRAADTPRHERALELIAGPLPEGFTIGRAAIAPPLANPYVWQLVFDGNEGVISGSVPSRALGDRLAAAGLAALPGLTLRSEVQLASGEPPAFEAYVLHALDLARRLATGRVILTGASLDLSGRARTPEEYEALLAVVAGPRPEGLSISSAIQPALAEAYVLEVARAGTGVQLIGLMPDEDARAEVLAEAERLFGAGEVQNRLQIADGAPRMDWIGAAKFALSQVLGLSGGSARISDHSYSITGAAATGETFEAIHLELARTLPASLVLAESLVSAPLASPFRFVAAVGPDVVTLSGVVPTPEMREAIVAAAEARFAPREIVVEARLASGAPAGFEAAVIAGLQAASRLEGGLVELTDLAVTVGGTAPYSGAVNRIETQLQDALPDGFTLTSNLIAKPVESEVTPAVCQELLITELGTGGIKFNEGAASIAPESEGRLDRLAAILQRCPTARIELGGYTDAEGTPQRNETLSRIRAEAVLNYLVAAGIAGDRLTAVGYGEANPIATNETVEGRAANRRIEFKVLEP